MLKTLLSSGLITLVICALPSDANTPAPVPPNVVEYMTQMKQKFERNLDSSMLRNSKTKIKFFLTSDGLIHDVQITQSSGNSDVDKECVDAAYCASPLSPPPPFRKSLPPPPAGELLPPNFFGASVYTYTFDESKNTSPNAVSETRFLLIPREVAFRYPKLFNLKELTNQSNIAANYPDAKTIENSRFQWSQFYRRNRAPTRDSIIRWSKKITDFYLSGKAAAWF